MKGEDSEPKKRGAKRKPPAAKSAKKKRRVASDADEEGGAHETPQGERGFKGSALVADADALWAARAEAAIVAFEKDVRKSLLKDDDRIALKQALVSTNVLFKAGSITPVNRDATLKHDGPLFSLYIRRPAASPEY